MRTNRPDHMPLDSNTPDYGTVVVVAEHKYRSTEPCPAEVDPICQDKTN